MSFFRRHSPPGDLTDDVSTSSGAAVGTTHSFEGAEADSVCLFPELSPPTARGRHSTGPLRDSAVRTGHGGITRARLKPVFCEAASPLAVSIAPVRA